jgi:Uma2 family endonuclease
MTLRTGYHAARVSRTAPIDAQTCAEESAFEYKKLVICDPPTCDRIVNERQALGLDGYDEVWDGDYVISPLANDEHQDVTTGLVVIIGVVVRWTGLGEVRAGINISDRKERWTENYRVPEIAVFLQNTKAVNCGTHWFGGADFTAEIISKGDLTREMLPFYSKIGTRELLIVDRFPWALELYGLKRKKLRLVGRSTADSPTWLRSTVLPLSFRLVAGTPRPQIEVRHHDSEQAWLV